MSLQFWNKGSAFLDEFHLNIQLLGNYLKMFIFSVGGKSQAFQS